MDNPLIDIGKLSEPLTKLIDVISLGCGKVYAPHGTVKQAKADATAKVITAKANEQVADIEFRAKNRVEHRELLRQENIEKITIQAARIMPTEVSDEAVDKDWVLKFINYSQDVCDEDLQVLWSRILAGETSEPGTYSKRTLEFLNTIDKFEAEKFSELCCFVFQDENKWCFIFEDNVTKNMMREKLGNYDILSHFANIGLLSESYTGNCNYWNEKNFSYFDFKYRGQSLTPKKKSNGIPKLDIPFGFRRFSQIGQQLFKISGAKCINNLPEDISKEFEKEVKLKFTSLND